MVSTHQAKPSPATTQGAFPTRHRQQHQQQLKRLSMATDADSAPALSAPHGTPSSDYNTSWLHTTTAAAAAAAELRPHSAAAWQASAPSAQHIAAAAMRANAHTDSRPGSAAVLSPSAGPQKNPKPSLQAGPTGSPTGPHPYGLSKGAAAAAAPAAALAAPAGHKAVRSVNITTSQAMHGLKDLSPDLWEATVPICR